MIGRIRTWWRGLDSDPARPHCSCWDYDGGPYGYNAHQCAAGCRVHAPCWCGV